MIAIVDNFAAELVPFLRDEILERSHRPSYGSKNVGGWKSTEDLFEWTDAPALGALRNALCELPEIRALLVKCRLVGWAMVNRNGSRHPRHIHAGRLVGIYFVAPGDPPVPTTFEEPTGKREIAPTAARLVTFKPGIWHSVARYEGSEPRITVAFEMRTIL